MLAGGSRVGPRGKAAFGVRRDRQGLGSQRVLCAYLAGRQASFSPFCSFRFPPQQVGHVRYRGTPSLSFLAQPRRRKLQLPSFLGPLRTLSSSPRPNFSPPLPLPPKSPIPPNNLATPLAPALRRRRCHQAISSSPQFHSLNSDSLLSQRLLTSSSPPPPPPSRGGKSQFDPSQPIPAPNCHTLPLPLPLPPGRSVCCLSSPPHRCGAGDPPPPVSHSHSFVPIHFIEAASQVMVVIPDSLTLTHRLTLATGHSLADTDTHGARAQVTLCL